MTLAGVAPATATGGCKSFYQLVAERSKIPTLRGLNELDPKSFQIFEKVRRDPDARIFAKELAHLEKKQFRGLFEQWRRTNGLARNLNHEYAVWRRASLKAPPEKWWKKTVKGLGTALFPYQILFRSDSAVQNILKKIIANPKYRLSSNELALIERKKLKADLERFQKDVRNGLGRSFARVSRIKTAGKIALWGIVVPTAALSLVANDYISVEQSMDPAHPQGMSKLDDKVELIFLSPLPHASVRIGGIVYNYGAPNIERYDLKTYAHLVGFGAGVSGNHTRVELKLKPEEVERLRDYLEDDVGKVYPLAIPFVDCVSQTNNAIKYATGIDVPWVADRSQAMTIAYYKLRKLLGDERVGAIEFASDDRGPVVAKAEDMAVNAVDSVMFMKVAGKVLFLAPSLDSKKLTLDLKPEPPQTPSQGN